MKLKTGKGIFIEIEDKCFVKGGQGGLHKITSRSINTPLVAKVYFDAISASRHANKSNKKIANMQKRLEYMVNHNPFAKSPDYIKRAFTWPVDTIFDVNGYFIGYLMPLIENSIKLTKLSSGIVLKSQWDKFNISHPYSLNTRLKVCYNIAQALEELHKSKTYTVVDLKTDNLLLTDNGFVTIIDMDSIQISQNRKVLFNANAHTPEFSPPELHLKKLDFASNYVNQSWDNYCFGIIAYLILLNVHPFMGITHKTNINISSFDNYLSNGYFPQGKHKNELSISAPHSNFSTLLSPELQKLFMRCFEDGHKNPDRRPSIEEWRKALMSEIKRNEPKKISAGINQPRSIPNKHTSPKVNLNGPLSPTYTPPVQRPTVPVSVISRFSLVPGTPNTAILIWNVTNSNSIMLNNLPVNAKGRKVVKLTNNVYTLKAYDINGNYVDSTITANFNVIIKEFSYRLIPNAIALKWSVSGASVKINNSNEQLIGQKQIPLKTGDIVLEATDQNGFVFEKRLQVNILTQIESFNLTLNPDSAFIEWSVINAATIDINGIHVKSAGKFQIPLKSETFIITAIDSAGNTVTKKIDAQIFATIKQFEVKNSSYSAEVVWETWYGKECYLNDVPIPMQGSIKVPLINKKFTLKLIGFDGSVKTKAISVKSSNFGKIISPKPIRDVVTFNSKKMITGMNTLLEKMKSITTVCVPEVKLNPGKKFIRGKLKLH